MGLVTQEDPIGIAGGLNLYGYANGDPINFSDPFGLWPDLSQKLAWRLAARVAQFLASVTDEAVVGGATLLGEEAAKITQEVVEEVDHGTQLLEQTADDAARELRPGRTVRQPRLDTRAVRAPANQSSGRVWNRVTRFGRVFTGPMTGILLMSPEDLQRYLNRSQGSGAD